MWGWYVLEYAWVLQRDPDSELNERILGHAKTVFKREVPEMDFDNMMRKTYQGQQKDKDCNYEDHIINSKNILYRKQGKQVN